MQPHYLLQQVSLSSLQEFYPLLELIVVLLQLHYLVEVAWISSLPVDVLPGNLLREAHLLERAPCSSLPITPPSSSSRCSQLKGRWTYIPLVASVCPDLPS